MIMGTSYFVRTRAAERYYKPYGCTKQAVEAKVTRGEIHVGIRPPTKRGESYYVNQEEGRYFIRSKS